jgi:hypothetical protein
MNKGRIPAMRKVNGFKERSGEINIGMRNGKQNRIRDTMMRGKRMVR